MRPLVFSILLAVVCPVLAGEQALHVQIDDHVATRDVVPQRCGDDEFLRRVALDLTGQPPTAAEVREFVASEAPDKRSQIVDQYLDSPECDRQLTDLLDVMLMERRSNQHVPQDDWHQWLFAQVRNRRPWNEIVRDVLQADGDEPATRAAARFYLDRQSEPHQLTRDVGRIFFGRDLQCAQCHNHPIIDDYLQADYHGLHAFLAPGYAVVRKVKKKEGDKEVTKDVTVHAEKAGSDLTFESVFFEGTLRRTGPRLPDDLSITEPFLYPGEEYEVQPADGVKSVPHVSRRARLAELATSGSNRAFNENIANRLWAHMLGRGLVHPVDLHHFDNPPTDPELLQLLGIQMAAMEFDLRAFLREIALSTPYQRPFDRPEETFEIAATAESMVSRLVSRHAELEQAAEAAGTDCEDAIDAWDTAQESYVPVAVELDAARKTYDEARKASTTAADARGKQAAELAKQQAVLAALQQAASSTAVAADAFTDDAQLQASADLFGKRAMEVEKSLAGLTGKLNELSAAADKAEVELQARRNDVDTVREQLPPLQEALAATERQMLESRRVMQQQKTAMTAVGVQRDAWQLLARLPVLQQQLAQSVARHEELAQQFSVQRQQLGEMETLVTQRKLTVTTMAQPLADAGQAVEAAAAVLSDRRKPVDAVQTTIEAAAEAATLLADDAVLAQVSATLAERLAPLQAELASAQAMLDAATAARDERQTDYDAAATALQQTMGEQEQQQQRCKNTEVSVAAAAEDQVELRTALDAAVASVTERWAASSQVASLKPLTPEQMCWSLLKVTGVYDRHRRTEAAKLEKETPLTAEQQQDPQQEAARARLIERRTYAALKGNVTQFIRFYANAAGQPQSDFFATADQALFVANASLLNSWIAPTSGNVTQRVIQAEDTAMAAEELYLAVLNRHPSTDETTDVTQVLSSSGENREQAARELVWGLLTSIEFRFNH